MTQEQIWIQVPNHDDVEVANVPAITAALDALRKEHKTQGNVVLAPAPNIPFDDMVGAMDAARAAQFPNVTVASGPPV